MTDIGFSIASPNPPESPWWCGQVGVRFLLKTLPWLAVLASLGMQCQIPRPTAIGAIRDKPSLYRNKTVLVVGRPCGTRVADPAWTFTLCDRTGEITVNTSRTPREIPAAGEWLVVAGDVRVGGRRVWDVAIDEFRLKDVWDAVVAEARLKVHSAPKPKSTREKPGPTPVPSEPRFEYSIGGGFTGRGNGSLTITSAGRVLRTSPWEPFADSWDITSSQVDAITKLFNKLDFMHMRSSPRLSPNNPDAFCYSITYRYRGWMNTVGAGDGGTPGHPFWRCLGALANVAEEHPPPVVCPESVAARRPHVDSIAVDGRPVVPGDTVRVDGRRSHRISWRGSTRDGRRVMRFSIEVREGRTGYYIAGNLNCPNGRFDYTFPGSSTLYTVGPTVYFSEGCPITQEFYVVCGESAGTVTVPRPRRAPRPTPSNRNRVVSIAVDGKPVTPGDTVTVDARRSHRISWSGSCAEGCRATRLSIAVRRGYMGEFIHLANSCPDGQLDYKFPASKVTLWVTPRVDFSDDTYAWEGFFVASRRRP